jgi:hypothetical protein
MTKNRTILRLCIKCFGTLEVASFISPTNDQPLTFHTVKIAQRKWVISQKHKTHSLPLSFSSKAVDGAMVIGVGLSASPTGCRERGKI